jgi:hypothetical protein
MKITAPRWLASLVGLLLLTLLVAVLAVTGSPGRGGVSAADVALPSSVALQASAAELGQAGVQPARAPSPTFATSPSARWIVTGIVAAAGIVAIAVWARARRRKAEYCSIHPGEAFCGAV